MPVTAAPPPVIVGPSGLPASICASLPEFVRDQKRYCVLGLRVTGDATALDKAGAKLGSEGWDIEIAQVSPTARLMMVKADGKTLADLTSLSDRLRNREFGLLTASAASLPVPGQ